MIRWRPAYRGQDSSLGFRAARENLAGDAKGKGPSGGPARPKVPMHRRGADCAGVAWKRGNARGAKGAGHSPEPPGPTGNGRSPTGSAEGGSLRWVARAG